MRKIVVILLVVLMAFSLSSCSSVKLEDDQEMYTISSDGSVRYTMMINGDEFASEIGFDFDKDKTRAIREAITDYLEENRINATLNSFKKSGDFAFVDITYNRLKDIMLSGSYELEDYADEYYGNIRTLADSAKFILYSKETTIDTDDIRKYTDNSIIAVADHADGTYYKLPGRILLVSGNMKYTKISNDTILVENGDSGYVVHRGKIDEEGVKATDAVKNETTAKAAPKGGVNLKDGKEMYILSKDGFITYRANALGEEIGSEVGFDFSKDSESNIKKAIEAYLKEEGIDARINELKKDGDMIYIDITYTDPDEVMYYMNNKLKDYADENYDGIEDLAEYQYFEHYSNKNKVDPGDLGKYLNDMIIEVDDMADGTYFQLPGKILLVSEDMEYTKIDDYTILVEGNDYGYVIYEGK